MERSSYHHGDLKNALIQAGIEILAHEGVQGLSLRKVAKEAGVSHAAPYAHFADKQALIAAISTEGYRRLFERISAARQRHPGDPAGQLAAAAWAYVQFAVEETDHFKITLSGVVEKEKDFPAFVAISRSSFDIVVELVTACQIVGVLRAGPPDLLAVSVWSLVHGFVCLLLEDQLSHAVLERWTVQGMLLQALNQLTLIPLEPAE